MKASSYPEAGRRRLQAAAATALLAAAGAACSGQQVTLARVIGGGDLAPDGIKWGGGPAALEGDRIACASRSEGAAVCVCGIRIGDPSSFNRAPFGRKQ